jgi:predicted nucleotidyltransferase
MTPSETAVRWRALADRVAEEYRAALGSELLGIALFGSAARGQAGPNSDLDLYAVTRRRIPLLDPRIDVAHRRARESAEYRGLVLDGYRPEPMPVFHSVAELTAHPWILLDISHHGIIVSDPDGVLTCELNAVRRRLTDLGARRVVQSDGTWYWDLKPDWRPGDVIEL